MERSFSGYFFRWANDTYYVANDRQSSEEKQVAGASNGRRRRCSLWVSAGPSTVVRQHCARSNAMESCLSLGQQRAFQGNDNGEFDLWERVLRLINFVPLALIRR